MNLEALYDFAVQHAEDLEAELATLREALEVLASIGPDAHLHQVRDIARKALKETK